VASLAETPDTALDEGCAAETLDRLIAKLGQAIGAARAAAAERWRGAAA
jgi:hypothetical protein